MADLPTGTVTFLFTDIEGSMGLAQQHPATWESARQRHHAILRAAVEAHHGYVFQVVGDAFCVAFATAPEALAAAVMTQRALHAEAWGETPIHVRIGLHTGAAEYRTGEYHGYLTLAHVQRVMSTAYGGQTLVSNATAALLSGQLWDGVSLRDMGEHRLKGLLNPEHLWQVVAPGLPQEFPALQTLNTIPNNLPIQLTSFVGRERELADLQRLLTTTRLLTLTGSGGTGKTRLSLQLAAEVLDHYKDGVWFVELAPLADAALLPQTVATALGLREEANRPILEGLIVYLREKTLLLLLDNCEHMVTASASLADTLLRAAPWLTILASSREALGIAGETTFHVPSLAVPNPKSQIPIEELNHFESVRLFTERAAAAKPGFVLGAANAQAVAQICARLDGIPLAIELAAARIKVFTPVQIAARLDDRFRLLTGGSRTALPRQQTLRALIDWSYGLLSESERVLLRRLSVFAGGWNFDAAEAVCIGDGIETEDLLDLLSHLVEKSLAVVDEAMDEPRFRMLETVRQYAREKLLDSGDAEALRTRHLRYYSAFTMLATPHLHRANPEVWLSRIETEHDNLRLAIAWSLQVGDEAQGATVVSDLWWFWYMHGYHDEAMEHFAEFLQRPLLQPRSALRARILNALGFFQGLGRDNWAAALDYLAEAYAIGRELHDLPIMGMSLAIQPYREFSLEEDLTEAQRKAEECVAIWRKCDDDWFLSWAIGGLAHVAILRHDYERAQPLLEQSAAMLRALHEKALLAGILRQLAYIALELNEMKRADSLTRESLQLNVDMREWQGVAGCLACIATIALARADNERAAKLMGATQKLVESSGFVLKIQDRQVLMQNMASHNQRMDSEAFAKASAEGRALTLEQAIALALQGSENNLPSA